MQSSEEYSTLHQIVFFNAPESKRILPTTYLYIHGYKFVYVCMGVQQHCYDTLVLLLIPDL